MPEPREWCTNLDVFLSVCIVPEVACCALLGSNVKYMPNVVVDEVSSTPKSRTWRMWDRLGYRAAPKLWCARRKTEPKTTT